NFPNPGSRRMTRTFFSSLVLVVSVVSIAQPCAAQKAQAPLNANSTSAVETSNKEKAEMAERVRREFLFAWNAYKQYAWGHDDLKPLSKGYHDWYGVSLYMTPVDSLDTMILMGLKDQAKDTRELIATKLSFNQDIYVKNFEITI